MKCRWICRSIVAAAVALAALPLGCGGPNVSSRCRDPGSWRPFQGAEALSPGLSGLQLYTTDSVPGDSCSIAERGFALVSFRMLPKGLSEAEARAEACVEADAVGAQLLLMQNRAPHPVTGASSGANQAMCTLVRIPGAATTDDYLVTYWVRNRTAELGLQVTELEADYRATGIRVKGVGAASPAGAAGIMVGDVIRAVEPTRDAGVEVTTVAEFVRLIARGNDFVIRVHRDGQELSVPVRLAAASR